MKALIFVFVIGVLFFSCKENKIADRKPHIHLPWTDTLYANDRTFYLPPHRMILGMQINSTLDTMFLALEPEIIRRDTFNWYHSEPIGSMQFTGKNAGISIGDVTINGDSTSLVNGGSKRKQVKHSKVSKFHDRMESYWKALTHADNSTWHIDTNLVGIYYPDTSKIITTLFYTPRDTTVPDRFGLRAIQDRKFIKQRDSLFKVVALKYKDSIWVNQWDSVMNLVEDHWASYEDAKKWIIANPRPIPDTVNHIKIRGGGFYYMPNPEDSADVVHMQEGDSIFYYKPDILHPNAKGSKKIKHSLLKWYSAPADTFWQKGHGRSKPMNNKRKYSNQ